MSAIAAKEMNARDTTAYHCRHLQFSRTYCLH